MQKIGKIKSKCRVSILATAAREMGIAFASEPALKENNDLAGIMGEINTQEIAISVMINQQRTFAVQDEKDGVRDEIIRDLAKAITGYLAVPVKPIRAAATALSDVFAPFGVSMATETYGVESGLINAFLSKATTPAMKEKTKTLPGIDLLLSSLAEAQADFETSYVAYESAVADKKAVESASALKPVLVETINNKLVTLLRALVMLNENQYGHFATVVGQIIAKANSSVKSGGSDD